MLSVIFCAFMCVFHVVGDIPQFTVVSKWPELTSLFLGVMMISRACTCAHPISVFSLREIFCLEVFNAAL
jgi:hypothetical protein